jgi:large subunit ribosomal protein L22
MGQPKNERALPDTAAKAINTIVRASPQKLNLVAQLIRGKRVERALAELTFSPKRLAVDVKKVLESAIANAENNHGLDVDSLIVAEAFVGKSLVMKRFHARGRGRASQVQKFFSNITVVVREEDETWPPKKGRKDTAAKSAAKTGVGTAEPSAAATAADAADQG